MIGGPGCKDSANRWLDVSALGRGSITCSEQAGYRPNHSVPAFGGSYTAEADYRSGRPNGRLALGQGSSALETLHRRSTSHLSRSRNSDVAVLLSSQSYQSDSSHSCWDDGTVLSFSWRLLWRAYYVLRCTHTFSTFRRNVLLYPGSKKQSRKKQEAMRADCMM